MDALLAGYDSDGSGDSGGGDDGGGGGSGGGGSGGGGNGGSEPAETSVLCGRHPDAIGTKRPRDGVAGVDGVRAGRVRSFAHVEGNFATHVYVPIELPRRCRKPLARALAAFRARMPSLQPCGGDAISDTTHPAGPTTTAAADDDDATAARQGASSVASTAATTAAAAGPG